MGGGIELFAGAGDTIKKNSPLDLFGVRKGAAADAALRDINASANDPRFRFTNADGTLRDNLRQTGQDFFGKQQLQSLADFTKTSPIATRLLQQQGFQNQQARNNLAAQSRSGLNNTLSSVAARGGLDSGARLRLAAASQRNNINARQGLQAQQIGATNQIFSDDARRAVSTLGQLAGFDRSDRQADLNTRLEEAKLQREAAAQRAQASAQIRQDASKNFLGK